MYTSAITHIYLRSQTADLFLVSKWFSFRFHFNLCEKGMKRGVCGQNGERGEMEAVEEKRFGIQ